MSDYRGLKLIELLEPEAFERKTPFGSIRIRPWRALVFIALLVWPFVTAATEIPSGATLVTNYVPDAELIDQAGKPVLFAALKGNLLLVGFIHTSCQGICEMLTAKMVSIAKQLEPSFGEKVTMVSVTTDPSEDGPAELAAYARKQGASGPGFLFLTGQRGEVAKVLRVYDVREGESTHVHDLYLIGPDGREVSHYNGAEIAASAVAADIRSALARR